MSGKLLRLGRGQTSGMIHSALHYGYFLSEILRYPEEASDPHKWIRENRDHLPRLWPRQWQRQSKVRTGPSWRRCTWQIPLPPLLGLENPVKPVIFTHPRPQGAGQQNWDPYGYGPSCTGPACSQILLQPNACA
jgi:hypothetical protein